MILCIDPGQTTGVVELGHHSFGVQMPVDYRLSVVGLTFQFPERSVLDQEIMNDFNSLFNNYPTIIYEEWRLRPNKGQEYKELIGPQVVGIIRFLAALNGLVIIKQTPKQKSVITDDVLKAFGLWWLDKPINERPHIRDASRHLIYYLTRTLKEEWALDVIRNM